MTTTTTTKIDTTASTVRYHCGHPGGYMSLAVEDHDPERWPVTVYLHGNPESLRRFACGIVDRLPGTDGLGTGTIEHRAHLLRGKVQRAEIDAADGFDEALELIDLVCRVLGLDATTADA